MNEAKTISFYTLGCKLNFAETSAIARSVEKEGYRVVEYGFQADFHILNTCSVTDFADKKCRTHVKEVLKFSPQSKIIIIGCYAQLKPEEILSIQGVSLVLGAHEKFRIADYLPGLFEQKHAQMVNTPIEELESFHSSWSISERTRSFLKVQDGCNYSCSFCTIPLARGKSRNDSISHILENVKEIAEQGITEIVLTGINLGDFGQSSGENFLGLIEALDQVDPIRRFRISSIEPNLLSEEIIAFVASSRKFVPHFHIPLQSGSDQILGLMRRRYRSALYSARIEAIKKVMPHCAIGVDVIVGFPGETREEFMQTYRFLNELDISYLHVFSYSERQNTLAVSMPGKVPEKEKAERNKMLHILSEKKKRSFYEQHIGLEMDVLLETDHKEGKMHGFTPNYIKVAVPYEARRMKKMVRVRLLSLDEQGNINGLILSEEHIQESELLHFSKI